jgi:hypothetical protein
MVKKAKQLSRSSKPRQRKGEQMSEQRQGKVSPTTVQVQSQFQSPFIQDRIQSTNEVSKLFGDLGTFFSERENKVATLEPDKRPTEPFPPIPDSILLKLDDYHSKGWFYYPGIFGHLSTWGFVAGSRAQYANVLWTLHGAHDNDPRRGLVFWA